MRRRQGPDVLPVTLERRRLYILPTGAGVAFGMLLFLMLLAGLNYGNSLALFLTFSLTAFALVAMQQCHRNLLGIAVIAASAPPVFARTTGAVHLTLANPAHLERARLEAAVPEVAAVAADLPPHERQRLELPLPARTRGIVRIDRLRLATAHPFGLFRGTRAARAPGLGRRRTSGWGCGRFATGTRPARSTGRPTRARRRCWSRNTARRDRSCTCSTSRN